MASPIELRVVINPSARNGAFFREWGAIRGKVLRALKLSPAQTETRIPESREEIEKVVRETLRAKIPRLMIVGGDGTFSSAIQGCLDFGSNESLDSMKSSGTTFCFFPGGRGNDFFRSLVGQNLRSADSLREAAFELFETGESLDTDLIRVTWKTDDDRVIQRACLNVASFGFTGTVTHHVNSQADWLKRTPLGNSAATYALQALRAATRYTREEIRVFVDGVEVCHGTFLLGVVLNGGFNGGGLHWSRAARLDDGLIELLLIEGASPSAILRAVPGLVSGNWEGVPGVHTFTGKKIRIERLGHILRTPFWETDGEQSEPSRLRVTELECIPRALRVLRRTQN